jgi:hypothetical protein
VTRKEVVEHAVRFDMPLDRLYEEFRPFGWDCDVPLVTLRASDVSAVVDRFLRGQLSAKEVYDWANLLECREDIGFVPEELGVAEEMIFWLANPEMNLPRGIIDHDNAIVIREKLNG